MRNFYFLEFFMGRVLYLFGKKIFEWVFGIENEILKESNVGRIVLYEEWERICCFRKMREEWSYRDGKVVSFVV